MSMLGTFLVRFGRADPSVHYYITRRSKGLCGGLGYPRERGSFILALCCLLYMRRAPFTPSSPCRAGAGVGRGASAYFFRNQPRRALWVFNNVMLSGNPGRDCPLVWGTLYPLLTEAFRCARQRRPRPISTPASAIFAGCRSSWLMAVGPLLRWNGRQACGAPRHLEMLCRLLVRGC